MCPEMLLNNQAADKIDNFPLDLSKNENKLAATDFRWKKHQHAMIDSSLKGIL